MERDLQKVLETLKSHEADNAFLNDICVMLLTNQIDQLRTTKKAIVDIQENIKEERIITQDQIQIIKDFVVEIAERLTFLENKS